MNALIPIVKTSLKQLLWRPSSVLIALSLACVAFSRAAQAVTPAPDGGYPNQNTAEGEDALLKLTTGSNNTAIGFQALVSNTDGQGNTAIGASQVRRPRFELANKERRTAPLLPVFTE